MFGAGACEFVRGEMIHATLLFSLVLIKIEGE